MIANAEQDPQFPTKMALWEQYNELRAEALRADRSPDEATEFYRQRRADMDAGAVVAASRNSTSRSAKESSDDRQRRTGP